MKGRTYRYMTEQPLFPFGYGLSYTDFKIGEGTLVVPGKGDSTNPDSSLFTLDSSLPLHLTVPVTNTGKREGTEVVQVYVKRMDDVNGPQKSLRGFARITLKPGETKNAEILLDAESFESFDEASNTVTTRPGAFQIFYGTSSADKDLKTLSVTLR